MGAAPRLIILLHCPVIAYDGRSMTVSSKFLQEIHQYARFWPGVVRLVAFQDEGWATAFSTETVDVASLPFEVDIRSHDGLDEQFLADGAAVVLSGVGFRYGEIADIGKRVGVPVVYVSEYSYATQRRITALETPGALRRARRAVWLRSHRGESRRSISSAAGLQCNGTPTFEEFAGLNENMMLYFDNRVTDDLLASPEDQAARAMRLRDPSHRLHLVFTGRLDRMKGAHHLVDVALELQCLGVPFDLSICGGGELLADISRRVEDEALTDVVHVHPPMAFADELMPFVRTEADLFVCCHPQGDPSCTYVETMACGVPYVGFANEALVGIAELSNAAWVSPVGDARSLAGKIALLDRDRQKIIDASERALEFACGHTFDVTYSRRIDHLRDIAGV
jgi:glycosyltransferase involved in cell wall biosynthesis